MAFKNKIKYPKIVTMFFSLLFYVCLSIRGWRKQGITKTKLSLNFSLIVRSARRMVSV